MAATVRKSRTNKVTDPLHRLTSLLHHEDQIARQIHKEHCGKGPWGAVCIFHECQTGMMLRSNVIRVT
jgi:hypothetical protein